MKMNTTTFAPSGARRLPIFMSTPILGGNGSDNGSVVFQILNFPVKDTAALESASGTHIGGHAARKGTLYAYRPVGNSTMPPSTGIRPVLGGRST